MTGPGVEFFPMGLVTSYQAVFAPGQHDFSGKGDGGDPCGGEVPGRRLFGVG